MKKITTCLDGSLCANAVSDAGIWVAKRLQKPLLLLHVIERKNVAKTENLSGTIGLGARSALLAEMTSIDEANSKAALEAGQKQLLNSVELATKAGCQAIEQRQRHGTWLEHIGELEEQTQLLVLGRSGGQEDSAFQTLDAYIETIIRQHKVPVLITYDQFAEPTSFMLAYDGNETTQQALQSMLNTDLLKGLTCHLVTVKNTDQKQHEKFVMAASLLEKHGIDVQANYLEGPIFDSLMAYKSQHQIDMLVMGAFSHSPLWQLFFGSHTLRVLENTSLPLLVLK